MLKVHRPLVEAVITGLRRILVGGEGSGKVVHEIIRADRRWGSRDRDFIASTVFDMVRNVRKCWNGLGEKGMPAAEDLPDPVLWKLWAAFRLMRSEPLPDWKELEGVTEFRHSGEWKINASLSDELDELGRAELGDKEWERSMDAMNGQGNIFVRVNVLKCDAEKLSGRLSKEGVPNRVISASCIKVEERKNLVSLSSFREGWFEIQDLSSQLVAPFADVKPGMLVVDACAGGGGKTLHLGAFMQNKGQILASDQNESRLGQLGERVKRSGLEIVRILDQEELLEKYRAKADRLLLDVPCTGSGTIRGEPEKKYRIDRNYMNSMIAVQREILEKHAPLLKPGGKLVYSTCSIFPSENGEQIRRFLERNKQFRLEEEKVIPPYLFGSDGFYIANSSNRLIE